MRSHVSVEREVSSGDTATLAGCGAGTWMGGVGRRGPDGRVCC
jgi:hypothetical protein